MSVYGDRTLSVVVGESLVVDDSLDDHEALRIFLDAAERRGHPAPSVVIGDDGTILTPAGYVDRMGVAHLRAGSWAFCRRPAAEALGLTPGTDWVRDHAPTMLFEYGSPFQAEPHFYSQPYLQAFDSADATVLNPLSSAHPVAWSTAGSHLVTLEERLGHHSATSRYVLWEYELGLGRRRALGTFPDIEASGFVELAYSPDDRWILLCFWNTFHSLLVRRSDGWVVPLPLRSRAVAWNGPNLMALTFDESIMELEVSDFELATGRSTLRRRIASPTGLPFRVRELSMSADGRQALVTAPLAERGLSQLRLGDIHVATVIDLDSGSVQPVLPFTTGTAGVERRHTSPRWCEDRPVSTTAVQVADELVEAGHPAGAEPDPPMLQDDLFRRWSEIVEGIGSAWRAGRLPRHRFAIEYIQHALSCAELDASATDRLLQPLWEEGNRSPATRSVLRTVSQNRAQDIRNLGPPPSPDPEPLRPSHPVAELEPAVSRLIDAETVPEAFHAAQALRYGTGFEGREGAEWWAWFEAVVAGLYDRGEHRAAARAVFAAMLWNGYYLRQEPTLIQSGLPPTPAEVEVPLLVTGHLSGHRLPATEVLAGDESGFTDVNDLRRRIQERLADLPLEAYLGSTDRYRQASDGGPPVIDPRRHADLAQIRHRWHPGITKDVFISHASEDKDAVALPLARRLTELGVSVWLDVLDLGIGANLRRRIDDGIRGARFGVAVLSKAFFAKSWTQWELDGLIVKELSGEQNLLPIWHCITGDEIRVISPSLANRVARSTADYSIEQIAAEIAAVIEPRRRW